MRIHGVHPVLEALKAGTVRRLRVAERAGDRLREVTELAAAAGIRVERVPPDAIDRLAHGATHQGVVADVESERAVGLRELAEGPAPLIVVLDGIEDPHNLGAILRTADAAGVSGVVVQTRRSALHAGTVAKTSAGALSHVRVAEVVNIARAIQELKDLGVWSVGLAGEAGQAYDQVDLTGPTALVMGAERPGTAPSGAGIVRFSGFNPDAGACREPERLGGSGHRSVRSPPPAQSANHPASK